MKFLSKAICWFSLQNLPHMQLYVSLSFVKLVWPLVRFISYSHDQDHVHISTTCYASTLSVAKMASHAIFQYIVLAIDDTHNTWTNMIVKMIILRLLGSSDDKEKIGKVRPG